MSLTVGGQPKIGGGTAITFEGDPGIPTHWELVGIDPQTQEETTAYGSLKWSMRITDIDGRAVNLYYSPTDDGKIGYTDRVKVKYGDA